MKTFIMLAVLISTGGPAALAYGPSAESANENRPTSVSIMTPDNWTRARLPNGTDQYEPLPVATFGRPGKVNCNIITMPDVESRAWSQETIDKSLAQIAPRFTQSSLGAEGSAFSLVMTPVSQEPIEVSNHKAFLVLSKGALSAQNLPSMKARFATAFFAEPGWEYVATCTAADRTDDGAEAAWEAWKPTLLNILGSLSVKY